MLELAGLTRVCAGKAVMWQGISQSMHPSAPSGRSPRPPRLRGVRTKSRAFHDLHITSKPH